MELLFKIGNFVMILLIDVEFDEGFRSTILANDSLCDWLLLTRGNYLGQGDRLQPSTAIQSMRVLYRRAFIFYYCHANSCSYNFRFSIHSGGLYGYFILSLPPAYHSGFKVQELKIGNVASFQLFLIVKGTVMPSSVQRDYNEPLLYIMDSSGSEIPFIHRPGLGASDKTLFNKPFCLCRTSVTCAVYPEHVAIMNT